MQFKNIEEKPMKLTRFTGMITIAAALLTACAPAQPPSVEPTDAEPDSAPTAEMTVEMTLEVAPESERIDLELPSFSNPTSVTNPLFPISDLHSALLLGKVEGLPFRTETTLLPDTRSIEWNGQQIEVLVSQYVAYLDGRIEEVALDFYAQADDGSVWYFGEDVFNYADGTVADTEGTWIAGGDVPPAMIMPADPQVGDVYRPENYWPVVFEEVTVKSTGVTIDGPHGPVEGAIIVEELHMDGATEEKTFAPGYGEFVTGGGGDLEALALAVPTDALDEPLPSELETIREGATTIFDAAEAGDWDVVSAELDMVTSAWDTYRAGGVPPMIDAWMGEALAELTAAINAQQPAETRQAALDVAQSALDLYLRYLPAAEVDCARFDLWAAQVLVDTSAGDTGAVLGDATVLEWIRDRFSHSLDSADAASMNELLATLRTAADAGDLDAAAAAAAQLREIIAAID
jgi:hypothetical protein